jgi:hypothetical protein
LAPICFRQTLGEDPFTLLDTIDDVMQHFSQEAPVVVVEKEGQLALFAFQSALTVFHRHLSSVPE